MMGIVVPETCWAYKKYNNKWHLVGFYSSVQMWHKHRNKLWQVQERDQKYGTELNSNI